jgi:RNA polymerase sigma-70 factor (ECF subfamily)
MIIDPTTVDFIHLVVHRTVTDLRRRGLVRRDEHQDCASALILEVLRVWANFDPERGTPQAFVNQVVSTRTNSLLRRRAAKKRRLRAGTLDGAAGRVADESADGRVRERASDLHGDLAVVLGRLTDRQRDICDQLLRESVSPAARELGLPRSTVRDEIARIRVVFEEAGLGEYL